jgi:hypothetical protein
MLSSNGTALKGGEEFPRWSRLCSLPKSPGLEGAGGPVGKDNIPILQLKWLYGKMKNFACFSSIILSPPNSNVKMSPHERKDIRVESEGTATSERDFQLR